MAQNFLPVTNAGISNFLALDYFTPGPAIAFDEIRNDKQVAFTIQPVKQTLSDPAFLPDYISGDEFAMAIGLIDTTPTAGTVSLIVGATTTGLGAIGATVSADDLETALNAALTTEGEPLCTVTELASGNFQITGATNGAITTGFFAVVSAALLYPISDAFFLEGSLGSGSSPYQLMFVMRQSPMCYAEPTVELAVADVSAPVIQAGDATHNKIQQIQFNVDSVMAGGYTINATANSVTSSCGTGTPLMDERELGLVLAQHPEINYQTPNEEDNIAVTKTGQTWTVEFIGTLKNSNAHSISVTNNDLVGPMGLSGVMDYNTYSLYIYSLSQSGESFQLTRSINRTRASGEVRTLYTDTVTVYKDMIDAATAVPTPLPSYYTAAQSDARFLNKVTMTATPSGGVLDLTNVTLTLPIAPTVINAQTGTSYTLALSDFDKLVTMTNAAANDLEVPLNATVALPVGFRVAVGQGGAGITSILPESGSVTIRSAGSLLDIASQYTIVSLIKVGTNEWWLVGALA